MNSISQLYLPSRLIAEPDKRTTKQGKLWVQLLIQIALTRETRPQEFQTESVVLPVQCFSGPAKLAEMLHVGDRLIIGCHLYGTQYEAPKGIKHGVQIIADSIVISHRWGLPNPPNIIPAASSG